MADAGPQRQSPVLCNPVQHAHCSRCDLQPACVICVARSGNEWLCCRCRWSVAPWNQDSRACPAAPCRVDRLFHDGDLRQRIREARREAAGGRHLPPLPLQGVLCPAQGLLFPVQDAERGHPAPARPGDAPQWHLLDTVEQNRFSPPGVKEVIARGLQVTPQGDALATVQASPQWMLELGKTMCDLGLDNSTAVLVGAQTQLFALDESPRATVGEPVLDPGPSEFPVQLYKAKHSTRRVRPLPASPTSSTRTPGLSSATRSPSPARPASEGPC